MEASSNKYVFRFEYITLQLSSEATAVLLPGEGVHDKWREVCCRDLTVPRSLSFNSPYC